jgi:predicted TIM-barrel fold metal-dependent hydrolase
MHVAEFLLWWERKTVLGRRDVRIILLAFCIFAMLLTQGHAAGPDRAEQLSGYEATIRGILAKGRLPIIDVEYHHGDKISLESLLGRMDANGVALTWLGPNEKLGSEESLRQYERYPSRIVPTAVHGDGPKWHGNDPQFLESLEKDAKSGHFLAMGEFEARHYPSSTNDRNVHKPVDSEGMQTIFRISSETEIPFLLHHEAEDVLLPELERMLMKYPKAKVVWCHVGRNRNRVTWKKFQDVSAVREFLQKYPNLYFDIVQSKPGSEDPRTRVVEAILYNSPRHLPFVYLESDWKKLFEEFPDRFVIGTDVNTGRFPQYDRVIITFRDVILSKINQEAAARMAYKNAWKLMTGKEWKD